MTIAVAADNDCWRYYKSGVLDHTHDCPTSIDHGVVIVGLVIVPNNEEEEEEEEEEEWVCRRAKRRERRQKQCEGYPEEEI